ncbi:MAG: winged helix-turn-helix transcriptional regulator [Candidatus Diapherotrites archaeon]|uniref:Winged helix-turn-helix transcriptional regulator n=1 Tax=Candidatus Iainarchaeum sp. TaxID=3101447 RepID=A0A8T3YR17_9ARCH|nr:winged helix-turn-helix transcriptional regulator [Candidatus Diapherotrites archaeon]
MFGGGLIIKESEFGKRSLSRNPLLFGLLQQIGLVEHVGSGISRIRNALSNAGLPEPKFEFTTFFTVTFTRPKIESPETTTPKTEGLIMDAISQNPSITKEKLAEQLGISVDGIKYHIKKLRQKKKLEWNGPSKGGHWEVKK